MIEAKTSDSAGFVQRLAAKATALAEAYAASRLLERRADPTRWRRAGLLWPLTTRND